MTKNNVRSLVREALASSDPSSHPYSNHMLAELLALNEEMVDQLHAERLGDAGRADFITGMIDQHETAAAMLRAQLELYQRNTPVNVLSCIQR